jgi:hypothetical protein
MSRKSTHKHHIIPRHMGGSNDSSNLVELSVEDHALAHKTLYELYGKIEDHYAYLALSGQITSDDARREVCRHRMLTNNPSKNPEVVKKILESRKEYRPSEETKKKLSEKFLGVKKSKQHADNIGKAKSKTYRVRTPTGDEIVIHCLRSYCIENNLTEQLMYKVASGVRKHHKGYTCEKLI